MTKPARSPSSPSDESFSLTILTPTYNRAHRLPDLYASLVRIADPDVEWLVVDDGSTDGTSAQVNGWVTDGAIRIRLLTKANGGKHTALNAGIATIASRLTMIVDSDDFLTDDAVEAIRELDARYRHRPGVCGYSFQRMGPDGASLLGGRLPAGEFVESYIDGRINRALDGDMAEVFATEALRANPFPEYPGERFLAEDVVLIRMALRCDLVFVDRPIYVCEYLAGGLTKSGRRLAVRSPRGAMERARLLMHPRCRFRVRLKGAALYVAYAGFAGVPLREAIWASGYRRLTLVGVLPGLVLRRRWRGLVAGPADA